MDNFEYSIQLNDRDWADFFSEAEECHLEEASLATADDQILSDTDPEENLQEEGPTRRSRQIKISLCSGELGPMSRIWAPTVHNIWGISDNHDVTPELHLSRDQDVLSGSEDEEDEISSVSRYLCDRDKTWQNQLDSTMLKTQMVSSCPSRTTRTSRSSRDIVSCEDLSHGQEGKGWTPEHNGADPLTSTLPNPFSSIQQSRIPYAKVEPWRNPGHNLDVTERPEGSLSSSMMGSPIEHSEEDSPGADILSTGPGTVFAPGQGRFYPVLMVGPQGEKSANARLSTLLPLACEDSSQKSIHISSTQGTQLGKYRGQGAHLINNGQQNIEEGSLGVELPILGGSGDEEVEDSRGEEVKSPNCNRLKWQSEIDNHHSKTQWYPHLDNLTEKMSLGEEVHGSLPDGNGIRRFGLLDSMPGSQTRIKTEGPVEDMAGIDRSVGKAISGDPTDPAPSTCTANPICIPNPDWEQQEGRDSGCFAPSIPDVFTPPEDKFTMTFPETYDFFFCENHEQGEPNARNIQANKPEALLVVDSEEAMSAPEIYEYFFCEGEKDDCMLERTPLVQGWCSRTRPPSPPAGEHSTEDQPTSISFPEAYEHFFDDSNRPISSHRGLFGMSSLRATGVPAAWRSFLPQRIRLQVKPVTSISTTEMKAGRQRQLCPLLMNPHLTKEESQEQGEASRKAIAIRGAHPRQLVIGQGDMCLVFLAFATWAVKTTDLQAPDAWKTALLANLGAVTAIRYLRRRARGEGGRLHQRCHEEPLL
ncbi:hypothetical protein NDU88_011349 [Pleurodeles waltl]|uniref:PGC-1 and ERR-induced regulator in muscle protein 1 n=1 Tax=Pleurodeles waltl TaxID=8319 RepID=A0AAV7QZR5_PLEWA|nr:hypothetical protein NDU88_011349 [Pleurodeles waltl]